MTAPSIHDHKASDDDQVEIQRTALDNGAHKYIVMRSTGITLPDHDAPTTIATSLHVGPGALTMEVLLAIVADQLRVHQQGPSSCRENALALTKTEEALQWLHHRTRDRRRRGVEGTSAK
jgi:hypothetical protein